MRDFELQGLMTPPRTGMVTYNMALTILEQEVEHEEDLKPARDLDLI